MKYLPLAFAFMSATANAQIVGLEGLPLGSSLILPSDGLGTDGIANSNGMWTNGTAAVYLFFGDNPEPYGWFTLQIPKALFPPAADGKMSRPICTISPGWTNNDYAAGYVNPRAPLLNLQQDAYDRVNWTQNFIWYSTAAIPSRSVFTIEINCPPKAGQHPASLP